MKIQVFQRSFFVICFCCIIPVHAYQLTGRSIFIPRSPSTDAARNLVGYCTAMSMDAAPENDLYGTLAFTPAYSQTFREGRIAGYFFNTDCIRLTGSKISERAETDLLADYFGLSPEFDSTVCMCPSINTLLFDIDAAFAYKKFFMRLHIPVEWTRWHFKLSETVGNNGVNEPFPAEYMAAQSVRSPVKSWKQAMTGQFLYGDMQQDRAFGILNGAHDSHGLADVNWNIGWRFLNNDNYYVDLALLMSAPTANRTNSIYFFEPIRGNNRHWEIGLAFNGRVLVWENGIDQALSLYGTVNVTHLARSRQIRSFDFCRNGFFSRYLLLKRFDATGEYDGTLLPAINVTTLPCKTWFAAQFDIVGMLGYRNKGFEFDFGYNAWARTKEHVCITGRIEDNRYGIKGIQNVTDAMGDPNSITQSTATIYGNELTPEEQNRTADPNSPIFIRTSDLDPLSGAATSAFTQKFFTYLGYTYSDYCYVNPYIGIGGSVEFEGISPERFVQANKNAASQWSIWVKCGAEF